MVTAKQHAADVALGEPAKLGLDEDLGVDVGSAIEEVACDQEGVDALSNGHVGGQAERVPRRLPKSAPDGR